MGIADFENLLKASMGLNVASIGSSAIERAVQERLGACNLEDPRAYWERVRDSDAELQELIEAVVVPETWFFRGRESLAALARLAHEEWLRRPDCVLSLLSLPCSTGEEPYSMAMALLDASIPADRFRIDAVDISTRVLTQAGRAVYGRNSFRGHELAFRDRHFEATAHGYRLSETVRRQVRFQQGNLFAAGFLPGVELYDVIFCRNVLIYFDRATQDRAIVVLKRLLKPNGVLFVAAAETGLPSSHDFVSANLPLGLCVSERRRRSARAERRSRSPQKAFNTSTRGDAGSCAWADARSACGPGCRPTNRSRDREVGRHRRGHAARRSRALRRSGDLLRRASAPARPVSGGVSSHGPRA